MKKYTLQQIRQTNTGTRSFLGMYYYRKVAVFPTFFIAKTSLSPNAVSILSLFLGLAAAYFFASVDYTYIIVGAILCQFAMILDYSDGQIARLKKLQSTRGAWLDVLTGMFQNNALVLGVTIGIFIRSQSYISLLIGFLALFAWNMTAFTYLVTAVFFPKMELKKTTLAREAHKAFMFNPEHFVINSDVYFMVFSVFGILKLLGFGLLILAVVGNLYWIVTACYTFVYTKDHQK